MEDLQLHTNPSGPILPLPLPYFSLWLSKALPLQNPELKLQGWALPSQPPHSLFPTATSTGSPALGS